ncbi:MAG TPA: flagellar hook-length control protein FliK [Caulobacteraceae bacterium]|nr:flagellar hook-length control protein FliK [Caulobacteraceae bacterium]
MSTAPVAPSLPLPALAAIDAAAVRALGVIAEAHTLAAPASPAEPAVAISTPASPIAAVIQSAASAQGGLAPLFADLAVALQAPNLPPPVAAAAAKVQALATPLDPPPTAAALKAATTQSGLLLEASLAQSGAPPSLDLKAALLSLRQALADAMAEGSPPAAALTAAAPESGAATPQPAIHAPIPPPPPYDSAALRAQPAVAPRLTPDTPWPVLVRVLMQGVSGAIARQVLYQLASAPSAPLASGAPPAQPHWLFEIPLATQQGVSPTPFEIARDGGRAPRGRQDGEPQWRARFSLELGTAGVVHARVAVGNGRARVTLWAERPDTAAVLDGRRGALAADLTAQAFDPSVAVFPGQPPNAAVDPGRFLDQAL